MASFSKRSLGKKDLDEKKKKEEEEKEAAKVCHSIRGVVFVLGK